ncbi:hypothetical protein SLEP1_g11040 [Rubroshorea leprosula]|uniref:Uncharacterized protein n=1 Tax=Rubroshorea leprosula TaxID=152421 RepID=A0AAV5IEI8_9ROSI|nr:hypothetical protein SLEP1_g11040 [Rubroshorea leprosula]
MPFFEDPIQRVAAILGFNSSSMVGGAACGGVGVDADAGCCTGAVNGQFSNVDENNLKIEKEISCRNLYLRTISVKS